MRYPLETVRAIADRHNIAGEPELLPEGGMVNEAWRIGDHILRICFLEDGKDEAEREAAVVPLVIEAGIRAPKLVAHDSHSDLVASPYTIYERVPDVLMGYCGKQPVDFRETYFEIGREIARLGRIDASEDLRKKLRIARDLQPWKTLGKAMAYEKLDIKEGYEISKWLEFVDPLAKEPTRKTIIHMDIHPWNVFVDPQKDRLTAIIDWGDTSWGDPALEFASMPIFAMPAMLLGYQEERGLMDEGFVARALRAGVSLSLWEIRELPVKEFERQWWRMPPGGWKETKELIREHFPELANFES